MTVYVLALLSIHDRERYGRYVRAFAETLRPYRGRVVVADVEPELLEGDAAPDKVVLIEFASRDEAERWASSDAYTTIAVDRRAAATATVLAVRSLDTSAAAVG